MSIEERAIEASRKIYDLLIPEEEAVAAPISGIIESVLREERRIALEAAAHCAEMFSMNKIDIHPDVKLDDMSESAKTVNHTTCQQVALEIRKLMEE